MMDDDAALFDVDSVRQAERAARARLPAGEQLMERAGQAAWRALLDRWPAAQRIAVVCGTGGNGGDGFVLARHALESGRTVRLLAVDAPSDPDAAQARDRYVAAGGAIEPFDSCIPAADVVVDALLGIGLAGPPRGPAAAVIEAINSHPAPVLALDVPSGLAPVAHGGAVVVADVTLEFLLPKAYLRTGRALDHVGRLLLAPLGETLLPGDIRPRAVALSSGALARWLTPRDRDSHKGHHGRVLLIGGDHGGGGAVLMAAEAALRCGAGLVRVYTRAEHVAPLLARVPEAMAGSGDAGPDLDWPDVVAIGCGLGQSAWARGLWQAAVGAGRPLVLDADALNLLAESPVGLPADCVLTPHPGEAARLLGRETATVQADRFSAADALVARYGCVVVLKGAGTIVAAPGCTSAVIGAGNPGMATGGMGDVLTGVITALRAQGLPAFDAARCGALLHACAGDAAAAEGGARAVADRPDGAAATPGEPAMKLFLSDAAATDALGRALASTLPAEPMVVHLVGDLGAGKSTLARALLRALGVQGSIRSPTYTLVERYPIDRGEAWHLDLYRIGDPGELEFLGLDPDEAVLWLVEWPERGTGSLPSADLEIHLSVERDGRVAAFTAHSRNAHGWLTAATAAFTVPNPHA